MDAALVVAIAGAILALGSLFPLRAEKTANPTITSGTPGAEDPPGRLIMGRVIAGVLGLVILGVGVAMTTKLQGILPGSMSATMQPDGGTVQFCQEFHGTTTIPAGKTVVLTHHNLQNGDPHKYAQYPPGWDGAAPSSSWSAVQYFDKTGSSVGQSYLVELIAVRLDDAEKFRGALDPAGGLDGDDTDKLIKDGKTLASTIVHRVAGTNC